MVLCWTNIASYITVEMATAYGDDSKHRVGLFHSVTEDDLQPGDHVYAYRSVGLYSHHGIYTGEEEEELIHFSGEQNSKRCARIRADTVEEFLQGSTLRLVAYDVGGGAKVFKRSGSVHTMKSRPAEEVVATAKHYLQKPLEWKEYHLLFNNCEDFAVYCKTGKTTVVPQGTREAGLTLGSAALATAAGVAIALVAAMVRR